MKFKYYIGTKVFFGAGCVKENMAEIGRLGQRAFIVTGSGSGRKSGALDDLTAVLKEMGVEYSVYDKVENNPSLECVNDAGSLAERFKADFIIGIGGGSPLDAAKAVAVLAVNDIDPLDLYRNDFRNKPLPVVAVPTTAGTGSEVTPYSILTRRDIQTKKSFGNEDTFPKIAFIDPEYIKSMPRDIRIYTAVDALSHAVEGYLSKRSTPMSDVFAEKAMEYFGLCAEKLGDSEISYDTREKLMYMAMLAGMVISHTGTTIVHSMGYSLTYFKGVHHGKANGLFLSEYLRFNYDHVKEKTNRLLDILKLKSIDSFDRLMARLIPNDIRLSWDDVQLYASIAAEQKNIGYNPREAKKEDLTAIMRKLFLNHAGDEKRG